MKNKLYFPTGSNMTRGRRERISEILEAEDISIRLASINGHPLLTHPDIAVTGGGPGTIFHEEIYLTPIIAPTYCGKFVVGPLKEIVRESDYTCMTLGVSTRVDFHSGQEILNLEVETKTKDGKSNPYLFYLQIRPDQLVLPK